MAYVRIRKISTRPSSARPRKLGVLVRNDEFYSKEDFTAIREGFEQIKRGEFITHDEFKRREGI